MEHFDRSGLSGEKERQIFAQIDQSDLIGEKECNQCVIEGTKILATLNGAYESQKQLANEVYLENHC